ncbi:TPA: tandem-95 repeat protein [Pseudomonas aeruginosa]|nr:tandem-95 repeat protein [Pseudomonas aeruginosa]
MPSESRTSPRERTGAHRSAFVRSLLGALATVLAIAFSGSAFAWSTHPDSKSGGHHPELLSQATCSYDRATTSYIADLNGGGGTAAVHDYEAHLLGRTMDRDSSPGFGMGGDGLYQVGNDIYFVGPFAEEWIQGPRQDRVTRWGYSICRINAGPVYQSTETETQWLSCPANTPSGSIYQTRTYDVYSDGSRQNYSGWTVYNNCYNGAPWVGDRSLSTWEDTGTAIGLSASDDGPGPYTYQIVSGPANGVASIGGDVLYFTPNANWNGTTSLTYRVMDGGGAWSNIATVYIQVNPVNDPPVAQPLWLTIDEDTIGSVILQAYDIDSPMPTVFQIVSAPNAAYGSVSRIGNVLTFTPAKDWYGTTTVTYQAQDSAGAWSAPATVTIVVQPVNDPPVAQPLSLTIDEDTSGAVTLQAYDIDSPVPTYFRIVTPPNAAQGSVSLNGNVATFTPVKDWNGTTSFTYQAQDSAGAWSAPATVTVVVRPVNDPPVAVPLSLTIDEDTTGSVTLQATDVDSPVPTIFRIVAAPNAGQGSVSLSGNVVTFTPVKDWNGTTSFTYQAQDSAGAWSAAATVTVVVRPVNDPPVAQPLSLTIDEDTTGTVTLQATDIDTPVPTIFRIVTAPNAGQGSVSLSGSVVTFTPVKDWNGTTSFTYQAQDSAGAWSASATVTIVVRPVNDPPVAAPLSLTIDEDTTGSVTLQATDVDSPVPTIFRIVAAPSAGQGGVSLSGSVVTFTPVKDWNGTTSFTYQAQDSAGAWSAAATVTIVVRPVNDPPVVIDRTLIQDEDTVGNLTLTATDVDSTVFTFEVVSGPSVGTVKLTGAALSFTPPADWNGSTSLTYRVKDDAGAWSNVATVSITVNPVNDIPVVQPVNLATDEDNQVSVTLAATDIDSAPNFVFELLNPMPATEGKVTLQGNVLTFTPALDWNGSTGLNYRARDPEGGWSTSARINITVRSVNDKPVKLVPIAIKTLESKSTTVNSKVQYYP